MSDLDLILGSFGALVYGAWIVMAVLVIVALVIGLVCYILYGKSHSKVYRALGYEHPGWAWIPILNIWALASCAFKGQKKVSIFHKFDVPIWLLQLAWLGQIVCGWIPVVGTYVGWAYSIIALGTCYIRLFSILEDKDEKDVTVVGYLSGFCSLIATVKWLKLDVSQITPNVQVQVNQASVEAQRLADVYSQTTTPVQPVQQAAPTQQVRPTAPAQSVKAPTPKPVQQVQPTSPTQEPTQPSVMQGATVTSTGTLVFNSSSKKK